MQLRFTSRGIIPPALFILALTLGQAPLKQTPVNRPVYITIGPEAPAILRVLVGNTAIVAAESGSFAKLLRQGPVSALVVPQEWAGGDDLEAARAAQIRIVRLKRHVSVAAVEENIITLGALTGADLIAAQWVKSINHGLDDIASSLHNTIRTRVLVLTPEGYTQGQGAFATELIDKAGGINVAAEAGIPEARQIDDDQVRQFAPEVVLLIGGWSRVEAQALASNPMYHGIAAFDHRRIYPIEPPGKDPTHLVSDVQELADLLHAPLF